MSTEDDTKQELLASHYSETFQVLKEVIGKRDRFFLYMLIVISLILVYMSAPTRVGGWINLFLGTQAGADSKNIGAVIDVNFIGAILWLGLVSITHTYFQTVLHVERQWNYLYQLEEQLSLPYNGLAFTREGRFYKDNRRLFSEWTKFIFWILCPLLLSFFIFFWFLFLFKVSGAPVGYLVIDSLLSGSVIISMILYLLAVYKKK